MQLSQNFSSGEFACKCGCGLGLKNLEKTTVGFHPGLILTLELTRERFKAPVIISRGYSCEKHNQAIGGKANSAHLDCDPIIAADFLQRGIRPITIYNFLDPMVGSFGGLGVYDNHVHVDFRGFKARWDKRTKKN